LAAAAKRFCGGGLVLGRLNRERGERPRTKPTPEASAENLLWRSLPEHVADHPTPIVFREQ
jgi:hypothetical protein